MWCDVYQSWQIIYFNNTAVDTEWGKMLHLHCIYVTIWVHTTRGCCCATFDMQALTNEDDLLYILHTTSQHDWHTLITLINQQIIGNTVSYSCYLGQLNQYFIPLTSQRSGTSVCHHKKIWSLFNLWMCKLICMQTCCICIYSSFLVQWHQ